MMIYNKKNIEPRAQKLSTCEQDFAHFASGRELDYYLARLDQLAFSGGHVLDAGCGQGQWAVALSQRFQKVAALDLKPERLEALSAVQRTMGIDNIVPQEGSIEKLPYADGIFDAVFCYGVIMFTDLPRVVAEFYRVLKPGGRVYVCLNADGWNHYLLEERGRHDPGLQEQARQILYSTYWMRYGTQLADAYRDEAPKWMRLLYNYIPRRFLTKLYPPGARLIKAPFLALGGDIEQQLCRDLRLLVKGHAPENVPGGIPRTYMPEETAPVLRDAGFIQFDWAPEGLLLYSPRQLAAPVCDSSYNGMLNVWEFCAVKPLPIAKKAFSILEYLNNNSGLLPPLNTNTPIIVGNTSELYPHSLARHWEETARKLGGRDFLARLVAEITEGAASENERFTRVLAFVQRRLFRDPVYQPWDAGTGLPSPLAILLSGRGRCGHCASLAGEMLQLAGLRTERLQLPRHVSLKAFVEGRWVLAETDAFKNGIIPRNKEGMLLGMDDIGENPLLLDCFPATGWRFQSDSRHLLGPGGERFTGYVDAHDWHIRGYVSGYFTPEAALAPPSVPRVSRFERQGGEVVLEWSPSIASSDPLSHYEVFVGSISRNWKNDDTGDELLVPLPCDILHATVTETRLQFAHPGTPFASVKAVGKRQATEPDIYFWPSEEVRLAE